MNCAEEWRQQEGTFVQLVREVFEAACAPVTSSKLL